MATSNPITASIWAGLAIPPAQLLNSTARPASQRQLAQAAEREAVSLTYGEDRVPGRVLNVLPAVGGKLLLVQALWGYGGTSISELLMGDQALPAGSSVTHYTGSQISADPQLLAAFQAQGVSSLPSLNGYAYSVVALPIKLVTAAPALSAKIRGRKVYDPRKDSTRAGGSGAQRLSAPSSWAWSDVPALAQADWTANSLYGAGLQVDWDSVAVLANANEQLVGGERRRVIGLTLSTAAEVRAVGETLRAYSGSWALPSAAGVKFIADAPGPSVASYSHDAGELLDLEPFELRDTSGVPTAVEVIYTDTSSQPWRDGSAIASLPGAGSSKPWRISQVRMPGIQRYSQALREATERLNKLNLTDLSTTIEVADIGIRHEKADIIDLTFPGLGIEAKPFRVVDVTMAQAGTWRLAVQEYDPAVYSDRVQAAPSIPNSSLSNPAGKPDPVRDLALTVVPGALRARRTPSNEPDYAGTIYRYGPSFETGVEVPGISDRNGMVWPWPPVGLVTVWAADFDSQGLVSDPVQASAQVTTEKLGINAAGDALNANPACDLPSAWVFSAGGALSSPTTAAGAVGTSFISFAPGANDQFAFSAETIPLNPAETYRLSAGLFAMPGNARDMYLGVRMFRANGAELSGADTGWGGSFAGYVFGGVPVSDGTWRRAGNDFGAGTDRPIPADVSYCRLLVWGQYSGSTAAQVVQAAQDVRLVNVTAARAAAAAAAAAQTVANTAQSSASSALSQLQTIRSNGYLDASEKPSIIKEWLAIAGERTGIVNQANTFGIVAERDSYTYTFDLLNGYLSALSPPYNDTTSDTPITPAVDQAKWADFYAARQALLNRIADEAGKRSQWSGVAGRPKSFVVRSQGYGSVLANSAPAGWWNGLRNAETGAELFGSARSYMVYEFDRAGNEVFKRSYDVYLGAGAQAAMAADLNYICDTRKGNFVVVYTYDEPWSNRMASGLPGAIYRCGGSQVRYGSPQFQARAAYILVGTAGCGEGNGCEVLTPGDTNAWAELGFQIQNGVLTISGASGGPRTLYDLGPVQTDHMAPNAATDTDALKIADLLQTFPLMTRPSTEFIDLPAHYYQNNTAAALPLELSVSGAQLYRPQPGGPDLLQVGLNVYDVTNASSPVYVDSFLTAPPAIGVNYDDTVTRIQLGLSTLLAVPSGRRYRFQCYFLHQAEVGVAPTSTPATVQTRGFSLRTTGIKR